MTPFVLAQAAASPEAIELVPSMWRMAGGLLVVLALLGGLAWFLKKTAATRRAGGAMHVETALALGERRSLVIVTVEGRRLVLGLAPNHVSLVTELKPAAFGDALARAEEPRS